MAEFSDTLSPAHEAMIAAQPVFFVATAAADARINLSPKGYDAFRVLSPSRVAWLDLGGSGNETNAHLLADDNGSGGRITLMFCNFRQPAQILRIYGRANRSCRGRAVGRAGGPFHPAPRHPPDLRYCRGKRADELRLWRSR
jgi:predicted pyridoxine 5'-phosphate oxidase superfamily flavin-nucleotide-binding protein